MISLMIVRSNVESEREDSSAINTKLEYPSFYLPFHTHTRTHNLRIRVRLLLRRDDPQESDS